MGAVRYSLYALSLLGSVWMYFAGCHVRGLWSVHMLYVLSGCCIQHCVHFALMCFGLAHHYLAVFIACGL